jgi:hypothetical protein
MQVYPTGNVRKRRCRRIPTRPIHVGSRVLGPVSSVAGGAMSTIWILASVVGLPRAVFYTLLYHAQPRQGNRLVTVWLQIGGSLVKVFRKLGKNPLRNRSLLYASGEGIRSHERDAWPVGQRIPVGVRPGGRPRHTRQAAGWKPGVDLPAFPSRYCLSQCDCPDDPGFAQLRGGCLGRPAW